MTDPTPLSPKAQAVWDAYKDASGGDYINGEWIQDHAGQIAAAIRAAADQLAQIPIVVGEPLRGSFAKSMAVVHVADLLAIAAELGPTTSAIHELRKGPGNPYGDKEAKQ